jgi:MFS family permease
MIELGAVLGVMIAGFIADKYGRKSAIKTLSESATLDQ